MLSEADHLPMDWQKNLQHHDSIPRGGVAADKYLRGGGRHHDTPESIAPYASLHSEFDALVCLHEAISLDFT